jgi:hypothetical protein
MTERPIELLLASAPLRKLPDISKRAPAFEAAWAAALAGDATAPIMVPEAAAKQLLRTALGLCEALGINGVERTQIYNDRIDAAEQASPADLDQLIATAAEELLKIMAGKPTKDAA